MRILFYDDAPSFGGHEKMTLTAIDYLCRFSNHEVILMYYKGNRLLAEALQTFPARAVESQFTGRGYTANLVWRSAIQGLQREIDSINPDLIVIVQGRIEMCVLGLLAAWYDKRRVISYLPLAHSWHYMQGGLRPFKHVFLDWTTNRLLYRIPQGYIVPNQGTAQLLRRHGVYVPIDVTYNAFNAEYLTFSDRLSARKQLELPQKKYLIGLVGRVEFRQKRQDFLVEMVSAHRSLFEDALFLLVGDGSDRQALEALIANRQIGDLVQVIPWMKDPGFLYSALDMVVIPSHYEGLPLVMLEAMAFNLPIVATSVDGMADFLPVQWLFENGNAADFARAISRVRALDNREQLATNCQLLHNEFSLKAFGMKFLQALERYNPEKFPN